MWKVGRAVELFKLTLPSHFPPSVAFGGLLNRHQKEAGVNVCVVGGVR
jgi:hypothetical protein